MQKRRGCRTAIAVPPSKQTSKEEHEEHNYSIRASCKTANVSRVVYYKWLNRKESDNEKLNRQLAERLEELHENHLDMGYRKLNDKLRHEDKIEVNDKRGYQKNTTFLP